MGMRFLDLFLRKFTNHILQFLTEAIELIQRNCTIRNQMSQIEHDILLSEFKLHSRFSPILTYSFIQRPKTF